MTDTNPASQPQASHHKHLQALHNARLYLVRLPGFDKGSNTSLNNEWVIVRNTTKKTVTFKG